jgi:hypothetical protein
LTGDSINILRKELNVAFSKEKDEHIIARIAQSGQPNPRHWWIYHMSNYSGSNTEFRVAQDTKVVQN